MKAVAEPSRWKILSLLRTRSMTGSQIARVLGVSRPLAHYHLKILHHAGLVDLEEQCVRGGVVENYYRARAYEFRTDQLFDNYRTGAEQGGGEAKVGEMAEGIIRTIVEVVKTDLAHPAVHAELARVGYHYQETVLMTQEQVVELHGGLHRLAERSLQKDRENWQQEDKGQRGGFHNIRFTFIVTPVAAFDFDIPHAEPAALEQAANLETGGEAVSG